MKESQFAQQVLACVKNFLRKDGNVCVCAYVHEREREKEAEYIFF